MPFHASDYAKFTHFKTTPVTAGVVHVEINRPKTINSFGSETWEQYFALFQQLDADRSVRCIVLSGRGKHFCSGLDLKEVLPKMTAFSDPSDTSFVERFQECINIPVLMKKPVVSVLHGVAFGLALDIVSAATIRIATKDTRLSIKEIDIGIMADIGSLQRLSVITGNTSKLNELALTGAEFNSTDALALGLISDVYDTKEDAIQRAYKVAEVISKKYVPAVVGTKKHLDLMNVGNDLVQEGLKSVAKDNTALMCDDQYKEFFKRVVRKLGSKL